MSLNALAQYAVSQPKLPGASGVGNLQRQILTKLRHQKSYVFHHALQWDIAGHRGGIKRTGSLCLGIETGYIKKSFIASFRRAIERLGEKGQIEVKDERVSNLGEALGHFPYHTWRLEVYQLRKKLIPSIAEYINEVSPSTDMEEMQLSKLRKTHYQRFTYARDMWKEIQENILLMLKHRHTDMHDEWLLCLIRGSHLFLENKFGHPKLLVTFYDDLKGQEEKTELEGRVVGQLRRLVDLAFDKRHLGLKDAYDEITYFMKGYGDNLKCEIKHYLRERHKDLITSLPGHEEPEDTIYPGMEGIRYSEYLDKLLTRHMFRKHRRIKAI